MIRTSEASELPRNNQATQKRRRNECALTVRPERLSNTVRM
jgi:hypothetical protein